jgi:hypothetical protein
MSFKETIVYCVVTVESFEVGRLMLVRKNFYKYLIHKERLKTF